MPLIEEEKKFGPIPGVKEIPINHRFTNHTVAIAECDTPGVAFTVKRKVAGSDASYDIDGGMILVAGESRALILPSTAEFIIDPSDLAANYKLVIGSY